MSDKVKNPKTGRMISKTGATFRLLVNMGYLNCDGTPADRSGIYKKKKKSYEFKYDDPAARPKKRKPLKIKIMKKTRKKTAREIDNERAEKEILKMKKQGATIRRKSPETIAKEKRRIKMAKSKRAIKTVVKRKAKRATNRAKKVGRVSDVTPSFV